MKFYIRLQINIVLILCFAIDTYGHILCFQQIEQSLNLYQRLQQPYNPHNYQINKEEEFNQIPTDNLVDIVNKFIRGNSEEAISLLKDVVSHMPLNGPSDYESLVIIQQAIAKCYINLGDYSNAEKYLLSNLDLLTSKDLKGNRQYRKTLDALSTVYIDLGMYEKANQFNNEAKHLYEEYVDFGDDYVLCLSNGALIQHGLGYKTLAKMLIDVARRQAKDNLSDLSYNETIERLENMYHNEVDNQSLYVEVRIFPYITTLSNAFSIYCDLGYRSDAVKTIKELIQVSEEYGIQDPIPYHNLGLFLLENFKFSQALDWLQKAYNLCRTRNQMVDVGFNTALALYLTTNPNYAQFSMEISSKMRDNIDEMFAFMSSEERGVYWKQFEKKFLLLNRMIYDSENTLLYGTIFDNILDAKGILLRSYNNIRDAVFRSGNEEDRNTFARIGALRQQLQTETDSLICINLEKEIDVLDKKLTRNVSAYADFENINNLNWESVRDALSDDEVAIEFYNIPIVWGRDSIHTMGEPRYCALVLKKGYEYPHIVSLFRQSSLDKLDREDFYETNAIYNLIWKPLEEELKGVENIYFAADRELHKIGIEYAPMPEGGYIGDKYNLYRLSSTRVLAEGKKATRKENAVLYGGLNYDMNKDDLIAESRSADYHPLTASRAFSDENLRYGVKYLPGTLKEVNEIAENFTNKPKVITDIAGTEESFKSLAGSPIDIIHLATHGFFWSEEDAEKRDYVSFLNKNNNIHQQEEDKALMRSGLFFSGANVGLKGESLPDDVEDGVLTALELSNMNLGNVDMVVMSACESGLGETSGEGVFGLQRGFKLAGANTLLMSLWKVDDNATQLLMTEFYKNYLSGKSKQESLRLAQKSLRDNSEFSDPQYWAAFILLDGLN